MQAVFFHAASRRVHKNDSIKLIAKTDRSGSTSAMTDTNRLQTVSLVGAGPGDPDLLTVAAIRAIEAADYILYDDLVSAEIVALARPETRLIHVGKRGHQPSCKQPEINQLIVTLAYTGVNVVRLKSGDPLIFGRAGEEIEACRKAGLAVKVIPGVTSAQGAAARLATTLTHRDHARRMQFITGHDRNGKLPEGMNWDAIADPHATTIVYMPLRTVKELATKAMDLGLPPDMPVVAMANATRKNERVLRSTIAQIAKDLEREKLGGPLLLMIGRVFSLAEEYP